MTAIQQVEGWPSRRAWAWRCLASAALTAALIGCGGSSNDGGSSGSGGAGGSGSATPYAQDRYTPAVSPQPLTVEVTNDDDRAVTQTITTAGGSMSVTGADGTSYVLTVPAGALVADLKIKMTPVARFNSLPFNGSDTGAAWGVQLEPSGQRFAKPLTLRITPPAGVSLPIDQQLPFTWDGQRRVALAPLDPTRGEIDLKLPHFSGWAVARNRLGLSASLWRLRERIGGDAEARLLSAYAERLAAARQEALLGRPDGMMAADLEAFWAAFEEQVIRPRVAAAGTSCAANRIAVETLLAITRQRELLGYSGAPYGGQALELMKAGASLCMEEEYVKCRDNHIVQDIVPAALVIMRQAELLNLTLPPGWQARAEQLIEQCHRYQLEVDSISGSTATGQDGWTFSERMSGSVPLRVEGSPLSLSFKITGSALLTASDYSMRYHDACSATDIHQAGATWRVSNLVVLRAEDGSIFDVALLYFPSDNASTHVARCDDPPYPIVDFFTWGKTYIANSFAIPGDFNPAIGPIFERWVIHQGERVLATKSVSATTSDGTGLSFDSQVQLKLVHTPGE